MMVSQGGTGSGVSGPSVEKIYEALYGVTSPTTVDPKKALMTVPPTKLPKISTAGRLTRVPTRPILPAWNPDLADIPGSKLFITTEADRTPKRGTHPTSSCFRQGLVISVVRSSTSRASPSRSP